MLALAALLALAACARPPAGNGSTQTIRDDTRDYDHPDHGMRDSHAM
jgi:hypothetical protein